MTYRPKIGLTMRLELETRRYYLGRDYCEALEAFGASPVHLPLIARREYIEDVVSGLDGVLLPGSDTDVDPAYFGEDPHPMIGRTIPAKDETDLLVLQAAETSAIPVLAICYGMQALNVSRGGSLIQDIDSQVDHKIKHQQGLPLERNSHFVQIEEDSILAGDSNTSRKVKVNSHHHQAIRNVGENLKVVAAAGDGVIEAIEDVRSDRFVLGVQWHPELSWSNDELSAMIFERFVEECRRGEHVNRQKAT